MIGLYSERWKRLVAGRRRRVTLGAQGVVSDAHGGVLLIRHTYRPGWHFPGGGVERGETVLDALQRELEEEAGILLAGAPRLVGLYSHFDVFPGDHIALFHVDAWHQPHVPLPNSEIAEQRFFAWTNLPSDINPSTKARVLEMFAGAVRSPSW